MKYGAGKAIKAKVRSVKKGDILSLVKFDVTHADEMAFILTTEKKWGFSRVMRYRSSSRRSMYCR